MTSAGGANTYGNIFKIKPNGTGFTNLLDFNLTNGGSPFGSLISDGTFLYGTTANGGTNNAGTIFKLCPPVTYSQSLTICAGQSVSVGAHTYTVSNTYYDTLNAVTTCDSIVTTNLTVLPLTAFSQTLTVCAGHSVTVGTHTYSVSNTYYDTIPRANKCDSVVTTNLMVTPLPIVTAAATANTVCSGTALTLTANGASTYVWSGGVSNGVAFTPTITATYTVTGTANTCTATTTKTITVKNSPNLTITATANTVCASSSTKLTASGASSYLWSGGITNNVSFVPSATTTYTVIGTAANNCTDTLTKTITVNNLPTVSVLSTNESATNACNGYLEAVANGVAPYTYLWSDSSAVNSPYRYHECNGTYTVTVTDANSCSAKATAHIGTNAAPAASNPLAISVTATDAGNSTICNGTAVATVTGGTAPYHINFAGNVTTGASTSLNNLCEGFYTVNVTDASSKTASYTFVVGSPSTTYTHTANPTFVDSTVVATPSANAQPNCTVNYSPSAISSVKITNFTLFGTDSISLVWTVYQSGSTTTTITSKYGGISGPGIYVFILQLYCTNRASGSIRASDEIEIGSRATGISILTADKDITIAPNPFTSQTTISFTQEQTNTTIKIIDVLGNVVKTATITGKQLIITKAELSSGTYFIQITDTNNNVINKKVIIQ